MQIRVFYDGRVSEYRLDGMASFSVGSGSSDTLRLSADGIVPGHVTFIREGNTWKMHCAGDVTARGSKVSDVVVAGPETYVLSRKARIALAVYETGLTQHLRLTPEACPISIGRAEDNTVVINALPVSKHHCVITYQKGSYYIQDVGSSTGTFVKEKKISGVQKLRKNAPIIVGSLTARMNDSLLELDIPKGIDCRIKSDAIDAVQADRTSDSRNITTGDDGKKYILYQRSPRLKQAIPTVDVEIESPPSVGGKPEINWLSTLLPAIITVGIALLASTASPMMMLYSLPMTIGGIVVTVVNYRKQMAKFNEQQETRLKKYTEHLDQAVHKIEQIQKHQMKSLLTSDPETEKCFDVVKGLDRTLWDRRPVDEDFCSVRIGSGSVRSAAVVKSPKVTVSLEDDELRDRPEKIRKQYSHIKGAPITCSLKDSHICGIVGSRQDSILLLKNMLAQFAVHQSYTEAKLVCVYDEADETQLRWVRDLPHAMDEERQVAYVASTKEEASHLFSAFADMLKSRKLDLEADNSYGAATWVLPYYVFVVAQPAFLEKDNPINEYILRRNDLGACMIMLVEDITQLPKECNIIIRVRDGAGEIFDKNNTAYRHKFVVDRASAGRFDAFGKRLKHIKCEEPGKKTGFPKNFTFYDMQGIEDVQDWDLEDSWKRSRIDQSISAPIGIGESGKLLELDLHEHSHGPHGLVAGTTGSGKSEVMLSYLLSLALRFPPSEIGFMIIDFKGGGMANQLAELPHLVGAITNLDEGEIDRSLSFIKAELLRRQRLFASADVNSIDEYIKLYRSGKINIPLSHLIILVDEFAELKAAQPDFMKELISASRIGRSLGIHLILATQKPAGQVSEDIWSNTRFQICLRVASREDSNEVIKSPLAFSIKEPGRAYLRVGDNEVFDLFQSGYSGSKTLDGNTQLEEVIRYIADYCRQEEVVRMPSIILPPLPTCIDMPALVEDNAKDQLPIGLFDDPDNQYQGELTLDFFQRNTFILGSALSGKTNFLQTIIRAAADMYSPDDVNQYILDFASMVLKNFENLRHVGGVVTSTEDEKLKNLFKLLNAEIEDRRKRFLELGISSYTAYREAGYTDKPRIMLLIDNLTMLREMYFADDDPLLPICQNGLTYGISVIVSNAQTSGIGYKYLANFANRIALFCNDSGEYTSFFDAHNKLRSANIPGRGIIEWNKSHYQVQIYRSFEGDKEVEQAQNIRSWVSDIGDRYSSSAVPIPEIPKTLEGSMLLRAADPDFANQGKHPIGLDYETVSVVGVNLANVGILGLAGHNPEDPRNMIRWLIKSSETICPDGIEFYLGDSIGRGMSDLKDNSLVTGYEYLPAKIPELVIAVEEKLAHRYNALMTGEADLDKESLLVLILAGATSIDAVTGNSAALTAYKNIIGKYKSLKACIILSECDNAQINYNSGDILKKLKEEQKLIFFGDLDTLKMIDVPYAVMKQFKKPLEQGDGYFIQGSDCKRIKTPSR